MRANGITYDTGFINAGVSTHEPFDGRDHKDGVDVRAKGWHL